MMKDQDINELFDRLKEDISLNEPSENHRARFKRKLASGQRTIKPMETRASYRYIWYAAALFVLALGIIWPISSAPSEVDLANVSPQMAHTQDYFTSTIAAELDKLKRAKNPQNEKVIEDALKQMAQLEEGYEGLKRDLPSSGMDKRVIAAMIQNLQARINLLESVLEQLEQLKTDPNHI